MERKLVSSIDSLQLLNRRGIDSLKMEHNHLKLLIVNVISNCVICEMSSDHPMEGIISYLTKQCGGNVSELNIVDIKSESIAENDSHETFEMIDSQRKYVADLESSKFFVSKNSPNQWICYEFKRHTVICSEYSIHTHPMNGIHGLHHPRSWIVEGSSDGKNWILLDEERDNNELRECDVWKSFGMKNQANVNEIRLRQIGPNHGGDDCLALSGFEVFGTMVGVLN
jgi:hypothetical protein